MLEDPNMANVSTTAGGLTRRRTPFVVQFYRSAVGKKYVMAITGIGLVLFAIGHMVGNLKVYLGAMPSGSKYAYHIDEYGEFLRELLVPIFPRTVVLWILRAGLIGMFALHMHAAFSLTVLNKKARAVAYQSKRDYVAANFASRTMRYSGLIFFLFLAWHLADLTWGLKGISGGGWVRGEVYNNMDASLSRIPVGILYVVANLALGTHLFHGAWSFFQSIGVNNPRFNKARRGFAVAIAGIIVLGNISFPIAFMTGLVGK